MPTSQKKFLIESRIFHAIPGLRIFVAVAKNINHTPEANRATKELLSTAWQEGARACMAYQNVQSHPRIRIWRECFQSLGIPTKKYSSSVESLLRRATKQPEACFVSALVDLYNALSLRYILPFGAFDLDELPLDAQLELRCTKTGDRFTALDALESCTVPTHEMAYAIGSEVITRHINWKQARLGLVQQGTTNAIFMSEILLGTPQNIVDSMTADLTGLLITLFKADCTAKILDAFNPSFSY